jgi:hypothetical protein
MAAVLALIFTITQRKYLAIPSVDFFCCFHLSSSAVLISAGWNYFCGVRSKEVGKFEGLDEYIFIYG